MVALVVLTTEETGLVLHGSLDDPTYRPMDRYGEDELEDDDEEESGFDASARHRISSLQRTVAAAYWRRYSVEVAVLLATLDQRSDQSSSTSLSVVALARAETPHRRGSGRTGARLLNLTEWHVLGEPLHFERLVSELPARAAVKVRQIMRTHIRPLPPATGDALTALLRRKIDGYESIARRLQEPRWSRRHEISEGGSLLEARDASMTALRLFEPGWRQLRPSDGLAAVPAELHSLVAHATENDLIADDVDVFPGWDRHRSQGGWVEFRSRGRRLLVKNVNVSQAETATGADLVYWRSEPDAFVIVQYKKLTSTNYGLVYQVDSRLSDQVRRMLACTKPDPSDLPTTPDSYRLIETSAFVKFAAPLTRHADDELIPGHYLPADLVELLLQRPSSSPRGRKILRIPEGRSLTSETFVQLVRDCWIGTTDRASDVLHDLLPGLRIDPPAYLTIAYDEPISAS